jgi:hypothetical protein
VIAAVLAAATYAIYDQRHTFVTTLGKVGPLAMIASVFFGLVGSGSTFPQWRAVLCGLGVRLRWSTGAKVFLVGQLGKYLPGSVWPILIQMEAGRAAGANRRTMIAANLISMANGCAVGVIVACILLPIYNAQALHRYWWVLLALPVLVVLLHPRAITGLLDRAMSLLHREPLGEQVQAKYLLVASGWSLMSWLGFGLHLGILVSAVGPGSPATWVLCTGAMALAIPAGLLFIPAPAGAGVREIILLLVLESLLPKGSALAVVLASRVILICCDLILAGGAAILGRRLSVAPAQA